MDLEMSTIVNLQEKLRCNPKVSNRVTNPYVEVGVEHMKK